MQEELVAGEVLVAYVTEAVPDEQVVQAVLMADEDSINAPRLRGGSIKKKMLHHFLRRVYRSLGQKPLKPFRWSWRLQKPRASFP